MWQDDYHGSVLLKEKNRLASFTWLAAQRPQAMLLPPGASDLAEWKHNLTGEIQGLGQNSENEILAHSEKVFPGGFLTYGTALAKSTGFLAEGQQLDRQANKLLAFAALPDQATVISVQRAIAANYTLVTSVKGICWQVPNDIFNKTVRQYKMAKGQFRLKGAEKSDCKNVTAGQWLNVDDKIGLATMDPAGLTLLRPEARQKLGSIYCDEVVSPYLPERKWYDKGETIYETAFALVLGPAEKTRQLAGSLKTLPGLPADILSIQARGQDDRDYLLLYNTGPVARPIELPRAKSLTGDFSGQLEAGQAVLMLLG